MSANFKLFTGSPFEELLKSSEVRALVRDRAERVLSAAQSGAPVETGTYQASLRIEDVTTDRAVARVVASVDYAHVVEANTGNLARALDAAGGS